MAFVASAISNSNFQWNDNTAFVPKTPPTHQNPTATKEFSANAVPGEVSDEEYEEYHRSIPQYPTFEFYNFMRLVVM